MWAGRAVRRVSNAQRPCTGPMSDLLLERAAELAAIDRAIRIARAGHGRHVLIAGPPGSGRTALLERARARAAAQGLSVLAAGGEAGERQFPLAVAGRLLEPTERYGALLELHARLAAAAPALVTVDDLHLCDAASLDWLAFVARRLQGSGIALVLGVDGSETGLIATLEETGAHVLWLRPFSERAVAAMLRVELGRAVSVEFARDCCRATGGNPLLVGAVAQSGGRVARFVERRFAPLPAGLRALAEASVVLGDAPTLRDAAELARLSADAAAAAADGLLAAGLVERDTLRLTPPLLARALYDAIPPARRALLHRNAAQCAARAGASAPAIARHLLQSAPAADRWTAAMLRRAAERGAGARRARRSRDVAAPRGVRGCRRRSGGLARRARARRAPTGRSGGDRPPRSCGGPRGAAPDRPHTRAVDARTTGARRGRRPGGAERGRPALRRGAPARRRDRGSRCSARGRGARARARPRGVPVCPGVRDAHPLRSADAGPSASARALGHARRLGSVPALVRAEAWLAVAAVYAGELEAAVVHATTALGAGPHTRLAGTARAALTLALIERDRLADADPLDDADTPELLLRPRAAAARALGSRGGARGLPRGARRRPAVARRLPRWPGATGRWRSQEHSAAVRFGAPRASAARCGRWPRSARRPSARSGAARRSTCSPGARHGSSTRTRSATSGRACAESARGATPASRCARRSTSPSAAAPPHSPRRAREELAASGARPRRLAQSGRDALTPAELRVAASRHAASPTARSRRAWS